MPTRDGQLTANYNLLEEEWIPVLYRDGRWDRVGIRKAFQDAGRIRDIAASNPMDRVAILRFLLALLYWCKGNPPDDRSANCSAPFPAEWFSKLDANRDCFDLLGDGRRFYQDRGARRSRPATDLLQEIPTGNNFWHFRHSTDGDDGICPACCALGLLRLPLFSVSGLPDLKSGINGSPPVYVVPWGMSLFAALQANWATHEDLGEPAWVKPDVRPAADENVPLLTGLTLLSRRIWLHEPSAPGVCIGCGVNTQSLIRTCEFQTAGKQENVLWNDPHVVYLDKMPRKAARTPDPVAAGKFRMDRPWPDLLARVAETGKFGSGGIPRSLLVVGFATNQAKNIDVWERIVTVPRGASIHDMAASLLRQWAKECWRLETDSRMGRSKVQRVAAVAAYRPHVEGKVSAKAGELVAGPAEAWEQAASEYRPTMTVIAQSLSPGFTTAAVLRREEIANVAPDMRPRTEPDKAPRRKKGGDT